MATESVNDKLTEVLQLFLSPDYNVTATTYLDLLLSHIATITVSFDEQDETCKLLKDWICNALNKWNDGKKPSQPIIIFTLKLIGVLGKNENNFDELETRKVFNQIFDIFHLRKNDLPASIEMAYTTLLLDSISHKTGRKWVISSGAWKDIVIFSQLNHTMYVVRESHKFIYELLIKESSNVEFCREVILLMSEPIINHTSDVQIHQALGDLYVDQTKALCTTLDLITNILENTVFLSMDNTIPNMINDLINLEDHVKALFDACISTRFLQYVHKLWILISFHKFKLGLQENGNTANTEHHEKLTGTLHYIHSNLLVKKLVIESLKTSKFSLKYWKKLQSLRPFNETEPWKFEHQAVALMITPMLAGFRKRLDHYDIKKMFVEKIFSLTSTSVQRLTYLIRDVVLKSDLPTEYIVKTSIDLLLDIVDIMERDVAALTFQGMCHLLKNYTLNGDEICDDNNRSKTKHQQNHRPTTKSFLDGDPIVERPVLLSTLLDGLATMTEKFQFRWSDCVETICIFSLAKDILDHNRTSPNLCVKALRLAKLAIENFMPPNLALLVDSHETYIEHTLFKRLHDPNWEVRDSVLEVLTTMAILSEAKYPPFQDLLLSHNFIPVITDIGLYDGESYVRASALIFLSTTIRINKLWEQKLSKLDLPEKIIKLFNEEEEGIVRRETVTLIKELYRHQRWPKSTINTICNVMAAAVISDLYWEVKVNALEFWHYFIESHLSDQGMLDGAFPTVTFSKENRKIVTLNESEIKRRLNKALDEMAKQNCLAVLLVALEDESDFEVSKTAGSIINKLKSFLLKYKLDEPIEQQNIAPKDSAVIDTKYVKVIPEATEFELKFGNNNQSGVIDDIVDTNDANLLATIYQNTMKVGDDDSYTKNDTLKRLPNLNRQEFLDKIFNTNIDQCIEERRRWLHNYTVSFDSIIDDILITHKQTDINSIDCY